MSSQGRRAPFSGKWYGTWGARGAGAALLIASAAIVAAIVLDRRSGEANHFVALLAAALAGAFATIAVVTSIPPAATKARLNDKNTASSVSPPSPATDALSQQQRVIQNTRCILYEAEITAQEGWQLETPGQENRFLTEVRVPDEAAAQRVLPLNVPAGQSYWSAWKASRSADDLPGMSQRRLRALIDGESAYSLDFRCTDRDGQVRWLHEDVTIEARGKGRWFAFGVVTDVSDAKRTEEALRQSEQRFASFMDNLPGPAFIKDAQGRILYLNRAAQVAGRPEHGEQWKGKTARDLYPPAVADVLESHDRQVLESRQPLQTLETIPLHDGVHQYLVNKFAYTGGAGQEVSLGGIAIDVTEQHRAEDEVRRQKRLLETLIETSPVGVLFTASEGNWQLYNRKYSDIRPLPESAVPSPPPAPDDSSDERRVEMIPSADGRIVVRWSVPVQGDDGRRIGRVTFVQDVTQQERDKQRLRSLARELSRADERERRRVAILLHDDVGQMLTCAVMELEALRPQLDAESSAAATHVADLLQRTLDTTRSLTVQLSPPVLRELGLLPALQWLATQTLESRGLNVRCDLTSDPIAINDEISLILFQAVRELFNNVLKHSRASSVVVRAWQEDRRQYICIEDNGIGFDSARWVAQPDTGNHFGLFNVREQLAGIGGTLEMESQPNRFTRACLCVPL